MKCKVTIVHYGGGKKTGLDAGQPGYRVEIQPITVAEVGPLKGRRPKLRPGDKRQLSLGAVR